MKERIPILILLISTLFLVLLFTEQGKGDTVPPNHYFSHCKEGNFSKAARGMSREEIKKLMGGNEYPPFETVKGGFCFAVDEKRSGFFCFDNWMPRDNLTRDFFLSENNLLYVHYDTENKVEAFSIYPLNKKLTPAEAGVEIKQEDNRVLKLQVKPVP
ncbi:MAG: hypothetical protein NT088_03950 [Candidatus Omnitrophica bacterium]|nr:hypothetical protein [Candidatus Omnitrophota bacterium]